MQHGGEDDLAMYKKVNEASITHIWLFNYPKREIARDFLRGRRSHETMKTSVRVIFITSVALPPLQIFDQSECKRPRWYANRLYKSAERHRVRHIR